MDEGAGVAWDGAELDNALASGEDRVAALDPLNCTQGLHKNMSKRWNLTHHLRIGTMLGKKRVTIFNEKNQSFKRVHQQR